MAKTCCRTERFSAPANTPLGELSRRDLLCRMGRGLGSVALSSLLFNDRCLGDTSADPLAAKPPHHPARARACIFLFMYGGPSQFDTFDPKPALKKYHGTRLKRIHSNRTEERIYVASPFQFKRYGQSGIEVSELFPHLAGGVDDIAILRSMYVDSDVHPNGVFQMNTGVLLPGAPSLGSWIVYGLGTENQNLPAFVVMSNEAVYSGASNWSNGYLPAATQGTLFQSTGEPVADLKPPPGMTRQRQEAAIDLLRDLNEPYVRQNPGNSELLARMKNYELAFRMQMSVPEATSIESEPESIKELYGLNEKVTEPIGRQCLLARRLVERGVRFVQIYSHGWDSHDRLALQHSQHALETDRPIAGLLKDLKQRGLLDQTLVVWGGEFGRSPDNEKGFFSTYPGRDHNRDAMVMWFAGGGIKGGTVVGATDELGFKAVEDRCHLHDVHATILSLMGLDDMRLTYYHAGRFKRLTDLGGRVVRQLVA